MPVVPVRAAFVTLAATDDYCPGALVVACSLRHHKTRHSLVCLAAPGLSSGARAALQAAFDEVVDVPRSDSGDARGLAVLGRPDLGITFTKIEAWALTNYSIACFLDADTVALKNVDELLDDTIYRPFAAAPDCGWPDCFNSGVFVFRPSWEEYERLKKLAAEEGSFDGADQGLMNTYFSSWSRSGVEHRLPFTYNVTPSAIYSYAPAFCAFRQGIAIFHFSGSKKPWHWTRLHDGSIVSNGDEFVTDVVRRWWNIHDVYVSKWNGQGQFSQQVALSFSGDPQAYGASGTPPTPDVPPQSDIGEYRVDWDAEDTQVKPVPAQMGSTSGTPAGPATTAGPATPVLPKMPAKATGIQKSNREVRLTSYASMDPSGPGRDGRP